MRTLVQNLRVGANWRSVIGSLARAVLLESEKTSRPTKARLDAAASSAVEAFHVCPSLDLLVAAMLEPGGVEHLDTRISLTPGQPPHTHCHSLSVRAKRHKPCPLYKRASLQGCCSSVVVNVQSVEGHEMESFVAVQVCHSSPCWPQSRREWGMPSSSCRANTSWQSTSMMASGHRYALQMEPNAFWIIAGSFRSALHRA